MYTMKNIVKVFLMSWILLVVSGCEDDFLDVNEDPNNPSEATIDLVLPAGQMSAAFVIGGQWQILGSLWAQHWTQSVGANQYAIVDNYNINESTYDRQYIELYSGALNDLNFVSERAEAQEDWSYFLIAESMQAYVFQVLVDLYSEIPYSEALQGSENPTPVFDGGEAIYADLIARVQTALEKDLSASTVSNVGTEDLVFQGDMDQWRRFANTLLLKLYMRQSEVNPSVAEQGIQQLFSSGAEFLQSDAEVDAFIDVQDFQNPFYATQVTSNGNGRGYVDIAASNTLLEFLLDNLDPRIDGIFNTPVNGGEHVGLDQGNFTNPDFATARDLSQPDIEPTTAVTFISAEESYFLQAEAVVRYNVAGNAEELYEMGITESFIEFTGSADGAENLFEDGSPYAFDGTIEQIITQKWVAMANYQGLEAHFEHLRTGYPEFFTTTPNNVTSGIFPKRLPYPSTELNNNRESIQAVGGQKQVIERVWWDPTS
jgi:hypothetical protein